jgi:hypothetical protein
LLEPAQDSVVNDIFRAQAANFSLVMPKSLMVF